MDWWCCAPNLVPPSLQKSLDATAGESLSIVKYRLSTLHNSRLLSTIVKEGEKKEKERPVSSQSPARSVAHSSPLRLLGGAASGASAESSRARTAQAASSGLQREA